MFSLSWSDGYESRRYMREVIINSLETIEPYQRKITHGGVEVGACGVAGVAVGGGDVNRVVVVEREHLLEGA